MQYMKNMFPNYGVLTSNFTNEQLQPITQEIEKIKRDFSRSETANADLAGQIQKEFWLTDSRKIIEELILPFADVYDTEFKWGKNIAILDNNLPYGLSKTWVNFQKKYEYNPPHLHSGVYSFVIWIHVPFDIKDEQAVFPNSEYGCNGNFSFQFTDIFGKICTHYLPVDKSWENRILFFPSCLTHSVLPFFTSDEYRISVSGNLILKTSN